MGYIVLSVIKNDFCGIMERIYLEVGYVKEIYFYFCQFDK